MDKDRIISEHMAHIGKQGGNATKSKGGDHYSKIGKAGARKRWDNRKVNFREEILRIKFQLDMGFISYAEAKEEAQPIIDAINDINITIAKKHNRKPQKFTFAGLMR